MTTNVALRITIDSAGCRSTDDLKKPLIINGETGRVEEREVKSAAVEQRFYTDDSLKGADEVIDCVTISHGQTRLLPPPDLLKVA